MTRRVVSLLLTLLLLQGSTPCATAQTEVPLQIAQFLRSLNIPADQIPVVYAEMLAGMAGSTAIMNYFNKIRVAGGTAIGLGQPIGQAARVAVLDTLVKGWSAMEAAVLENLHQLAERAAHTQLAELPAHLRNPAALFRSLVANSANWGQGFLNIYQKLGGARTAAAASRGGFVTLPVLLVTVTAIVAGTAGFVAGKAILKKQDLEVRAAEQEAYFNTVSNLIVSMQSGRTRLLPGLNQERAIQRIIRNLDAGLPPYSDILEVRPAPDISGGWQGELWVKDVEGQSNIQVGQKRSVTPSQFRIDQDANEVVLTFGGNQIKGYFGAPDYLPSTAGSSRVLTVVDNAILTETIQGSLIRAALKFYGGAGAGGLSNRLEVEIEQRSASAVITSGGQLTR